MDQWAECLEMIDGDSSAWRRYLDEDPPESLADRARLAMIRKLIGEGHAGTALDARSRLSPELQAQADEALLEVDDPSIRLEAARRLTVSAPLRLRSVDPDLDRQLLQGLGEEQRLRRARAWLRDGSPSQVLAELRPLRWRGANEVQRRHVVARAELDRGSPRGALRVLPNGRDAGAEDWQLRARAHRNRAWSLWPGRGERAAFTDCATAAGRAIQDNAPLEVRHRALALRLECATEAERLDDALEAWWMLAREGWVDSRRGWLGRRLGVALANRGGFRNEVLALAEVLPSHSRCLRFWAAIDSATELSPLEGLAEGDVPDLYSLWVRDAAGFPPAQDISLAPAVLAAEPPASVGRLIAAGAETEAAREWRRIRRRRGTFPGEAVAGSALAMQVGFPLETIRWLRAASPHLGSVHMRTVPENIARAYLPLRWPSELLVAARESGLDPWLVAAVARQESGFTAHAVSPRGAIGVLQMLPSTASVHSRALGLGGNPDLRNPGINLRLGTRELARLIQRFGNVEPALAAYNAGETRIRGWWKRQPDPRRFTEEIPIPETYNYVRRVMYLSEAYRLVHSEAWRNPP
jgi:soluble lytic murein transglycosylase